MIEPTRKQPAASKEAVKARREAEVARAVNEFINRDLLGSSSPEAEPDRDLKVREVLDRASQTIPGRFADQPLVEAAIQKTIGDSYLALGLYDEADPHLQRARELYLQTLGPDHGESIDANLTLNSLTLHRGRYQEAENALHQIVAHSTRVLGPEHRTTLASMNNLAEAYRAVGRYDDALRLHEELVPLHRRLLGAEHPSTLLAMNNMANSYRPSVVTRRPFNCTKRRCDSGASTWGPTIRTRCRR